MKICLTLGVHSSARNNADRGSRERLKCFAVSEQVGGREGIRTPDPLLAKQISVRGEIY